MTLPDSGPQYQTAVLGMGSRSSIDLFTRSTGSLFPISIQVLHHCGPGARKSHYDAFVKLIECTPVPFLSIRDKEDSATTRLMAMISSVEISTGGNLNWFVEVNIFRQSLRIECFDCRANETN